MKILLIVFQVFFIINITIPNLSHALGNAEGSLWNPLNTIAWWKKKGNPKRVLEDVLTISSYKKNKKESEEWKAFGLKRIEDIKKQILKYQLTEEEKEKIIVVAINAHSLYKEGILSEKQVDEYYKKHLSKEIRRKLKIINMGVETLLSITDGIDMYDKKNQKILSAAVDVLRVAAIAAGILLGGKVAFGGAKFVVNCGARISYNFSTIATVNAQMALLYGAFKATGHTKYRDGAFLFGFPLSMLPYIFIEDGALKKIINKK